MFIYSIKRHRVWCDGTWINNVFSYELLVHDTLVHTFFWLLERNPFTRPVWSPLVLSVPVFPPLPCFVGREESGGLTLCSVPILIPEPCVGTDSFHLHSVIFLPKLSLLVPIQDLRGKWSTSWNPFKYSGKGVDILPNLLGSNMAYSQNVVLMCSITCTRVKFDVVTHGNPPSENY